MATMAMNEDDKHAGVHEHVSEVLESPIRYSEARDKIDMDRIGKKQELKRNFRLLSIFSFMCIAMSSWVFVIRRVEFIVGGLCCN